MSIGKKILKNYLGAITVCLKAKPIIGFWTFDTERDDVFLQDDDPVALLVEDLHGVPIIDQLENTVDIYPAVFKTRGDDINTWIKIPFDINS